MCPVRYHQWAALSLLGMQVGRSVWLDQSYYEVYCMNYICLVGLQGSRKSTAKNEARKMFKEINPNYPIGASVTSREKIVERMAVESALRYFNTPEGLEVAYTPLAFFINELKNFLSIDIEKMIEFLTDVYDEPMFDADTIKHGLQPIVRPTINILACETPRWVIGKLKSEILSGGFSRRLLFVYEVAKPKYIAFPSVTLEMQLAADRCKAHLEKLKLLSGCFAWESQETKDYFEQYFVKLPAIEDEILEGFYNSRDTLALKFAMILAVAEYEPKLVLTKSLLQAAFAFTATIEENLPKLSIGLGRNVLALPQQKLMTILNDAGGFMQYKELRRKIEKELGWREQAEVFRHLEETEQVIRRSWKFTGGIEKEVIITPEKFADLVKNGTIKEEKNGNV